MEALNRFDSGMACASGEEESKVFATRRVEAVDEVLPLLRAHLRAARDDAAARDEHIRSSRREHMQCVVSPDVLVMNAQFIGCLLDYTSLCPHLS